MITADPKLLEWVQSLEGRIHELEQHAKINQARVDHLANVVQRFTAAAESNGFQIEQILDMVRQLAARAGLPAGLS